MLQALRANWFIFLFSAVFVSISPIQNLIGLDRVPDAIALLLHRHFLIFSLFVALSAFAETLFVVSLYYPGTIVIFSALFAVQGADAWQQTLLCVFLYFAIIGGALANYLTAFGASDFVFSLRHNRLIEESRNIFTRLGKFAALVSALHPNYLGLFFVSNGLFRLPLMPNLLIVMIALPFVLCGWLAFAHILAISSSPKEFLNTFYLGALIFCFGIFKSAFDYFRSANA